MDNLTHTLTGMVLARARIVRAGPLVTAAFVAGANAPDVDLAWSTGSDLAYYALHRGFTHSLVGAPLVAAGLWLLLLAIDRLVRRRSTDRVDPLPLLAACTLGVASHVALDAANAYGVRPFLPWSDRWFYGDVLMIADPWIWLLLGGALYLTRSPGRWISAVWAVSAAIGTAAMAALPVVPLLSLVVWIALLAAIAVHGRRSGPGRDDSRRLARAAVAIFLAYGGLCLASRATAAVRIAREASSPASALLPRPADPFRWNALWVDGATVRSRVVGAVAALDRDVDRFERTGAAIDDPSVAAVLGTCAGRVVQDFFRFPVASVRPSADGSALVRIQDLRFARDGSGRFAVFEVTVDPSGRAVVDPAECP